MPKLSDTIGILKIGKKTFKKPEWWNSKHQLNKQIKSEEKTVKLIKKHTPRIAGEYTINTLESQPATDVYVKQLHSQLDNTKYNELAPWNPAFRKSYVILVNKK